MRLLNYGKEIVQKHAVELDEPIKGVRKWVRVENNGKLVHWKPIEAQDMRIENLNGLLIKDPSHEIEMKFRKSQYNER